MDQKRAKIEALLKLSSDVKFENNSISGTIQPVSRDDIALINEFIDQKFNDDFQYTKVIPKANESSSYRLNLIRDGQNYASYQSYIEHKFDISKKCISSDDDIIYESLYARNKGGDDYSAELELFSKFIRALSENYFQKDNVLVFFSKNYCEVPVQIRSFEKYLALAKSYKENDNLVKSLKEFLDWILEQKNEANSATEPLNIHKSELYVLVATEVIEHLTSIDKRDRIFYLIKNIDTVLQDSKSKYSLYLEDFKYSKFTEKINKYSEEFLNRVNKVITDLQSQILAIPLAISAITLFKETDKINDYIYIGFSIYLIMVLYASCQQAYNLKHIKTQIIQFNDVAKLPKELSLQWKKEIKPINRKILCHQIFLIFVSLFIGFLIGICIINIDYLTNILANTLFFIWSSILLCFYFIYKIIRYISCRKAK